MDKTNIKILFLIFHGFNEANGISKKIRYQVKALRACGTDTRLCYYDIAPDGHRLWKAEEQVIADLGTGKMAKIKNVSHFILYVSMHAEKVSTSFTFVRIIMQIHSPSRW